MLSAPERVELLKKTYMFSGLSESDLKMLAPVFKQRSLERDQVLFRQNEPGDSLAVVISGLLSIEVDRLENGQVVRTQVARLEPLEVVGEMACIDPAPRSATVLAFEPTEALVLTRNMLEALRVNALLLYTKVVQGIGRGIAERLRQTDQKISLAVVYGDNHDQRIESMPRAILLPNPPAAQPWTGGQLALPHEGALRAFPPQELSVLLSAGQVRLYPNNGLLCREGQAAHSCFIIVQGTVDIVKAIGAKHHVIAQSGVGSLLGQLALIDRIQRAATVRAKGEVVAVELTRDTFDALLAANSPLAVRFQELVTISTIRQLRITNGTFASVPKDQMIMALMMAEMAEDDDTIEVVAPDFGADDLNDVDRMAASFLQSSMREMGITARDLQAVRVAAMDGQVTQAELRARMNR